MENINLILKEIVIKLAVVEIIFLIIYTIILVKYGEKISEWLEKIFYN